MQTDVVVAPGDTTPEETVTVPDTSADAAEDVGALEVSPGDDTSDAATLADAVTDGSNDAGMVDTSTDTPGLDAASDSGPGDVTESDAESLPEWACTSEQKCTGANEICFGPEDNFCGICMDPQWPCQDDGQCDEGTVCGEEAPPCSCTGETECVSACTPGLECDQGKLCDDGGHCTAKPCVDGLECPANFSCISGGPVDMPVSGTCQRTTCSQSSECDDHCVKGKCYGIPGNCSPPPP